MLNVGLQTRSAVLPTLTKGSGTCKWLAMNLTNYTVQSQFRGGLFHYSNYFIGLVTQMEGLRGSVLSTAHNVTERGIRTGIPTRIYSPASGDPKQYWRLTPS